MKITKLRRVGVYVLSGYKGALAIKNVATGESARYRSMGRIEDGMDALAELLKDGIGLDEAVERLPHLLQA